MPSHKDQKVSTFTVNFRWKFAVKPKTCDKSEVHKVYFSFPKTEIGISKLRKVKGCKILCVVKLGNLFLYAMRIEPVEGFYYIYSSVFVTKSRRR